MRIACGIIFTGFGLLLVFSFTRAYQPGAGVENAIDYFRNQSQEFSAAANRLQTAIASLSNDPATVINARRELKNCRLNYKKIEFFLEYFFKSTAHIYNAPPKYEIEEPYMEYQEPIGMQVMEGLLFEKKPLDKKQELLQQADAINSSARDLGALLYDFTANDKQLLESARLELIRMITLGITGFDAPFLKSGIAEAEISLTALQYILHPYLDAGSPGSGQLSAYLANAIRYLHLHTDFDSFDRMKFLTDYALPMQQQLSRLIRELKLYQNTTTVLDYEADNIFDPRAIRLDAFPGAKNTMDTALVQLGKKLFFETGLSGNNTISCATCHDPSKHFTDALPKSLAFDGHSHVQRNAASLLYAGYQYQQFWDGRAPSLEDQVKTVINNSTEMNGGTETIQRLLEEKPAYKKSLSTVFIKDTLSIQDKVAVCIAAFVRSLHPRNSRFDKYIQGNNISLTQREIKGFNLFMGKAQCATCHFAPLFNGLTPPLYNLSELEVLGTTKTDNLLKPVADTDRGRFNVFPIVYYEKAFKTPTVRNVSATGPYMHNGAFKKLETVIEFYNKGGGNGLGLSINTQTLSSQPLHLTKDEISCITAFLHSLEDSVDNYSQSANK